MSLFKGSTKRIIILLVISLCVLPEGASCDGEYVFDTEVKVPGGLTVLGEGSATHCRTSTNKTWLFIVDNDNVRFTRLKLEGADTTQNNENNTRGIDINGGKNIRIDHCELLGFCYATCFSNGATARVDHCYIHHCPRAGLGYGVVVYSGAKVMVCDNEFSQCRHSLASNGALDWGSPERVGKYLHKLEVEKTHWEFIHNRVERDDETKYRLCAVDTHPGMDGTFYVEANIFKNIRHGVGIRDGSGIIQRNLFLDLSGNKPVAISVSYGTHNNIPVENAMPHDIEVSENTFINVENRYRIRDAVNITIDGQLLEETTGEGAVKALEKAGIEHPETVFELTPSNMPLIEFTENDGKLQLSNRDRRLKTTGRGRVMGSVVGLSEKPVPEAAVYLGINSVNTDKNGEFQFLNVSSGLRFIVVTKQGYETTFKSFRLLPEGVSNLKIILPQK